MPFAIGIIAVFAGAFGIGLYLRQIGAERRRAVYPDPATLLIDPDTELVVKRDAENRLEVRPLGNKQVQQVRVRGTVDSQASDNPSMELVEIADGAIPPFEGLDPATRHYFEVTYDDGSKAVFAERILPLEGAINFRDIGGYRTKDGRQVKWGQVYRAGTLAELTENDYAYLQQLGIKLVCDMRSPEEVADDPDKLPEEGFQYVHLPLEAEIPTITRLRAIFFSQSQVAQLVPELYTRLMIDRNAHIFGEILQRIANPDNLPTVVHCTAGKDRTGVSSALLLAWLGVPDETITADYTVSNLYYDTFYQIAEKALKPIAMLGVKPEDVRPLISAEAKNMQYTLDYTRQKYGSIEGYLKNEADLDDETLQALRDNLLL